MCTTCGCGEPTTHAHNEQEQLIKMEQDVLHKNQLQAERNRGFFEARNIKAINLLSSPGSGKTTLLEKTITSIGDNFDFYVIEGDQQSSRDADRIAKTGAKVWQINTGKGCHLDSAMVHYALHKLEPVDNAFLMIENVGNLVCPALFDLGEHKRVVIMSVTEGDDKPLKYPDIFHSAHICILNKIDLLPYVDFDITAAEDYLHRLNPNMEVITISATTGEGMNDWYSWIEKESRMLVV